MVTNVKLTASIYIVLSLSLSACSWVDSTGKQANATPTLIDPTLVILDEGDSFPINENTQRTVVFSEDDNLLTDWRWNLLDSQANIQQCLGFDNFEQRYASNSLRQACADQESCTVKFEEVSAQNTTRFNITTPHMRAPAALEYLLQATNATGGVVERKQVVCAIPVNDAPDARDDQVTVMRGMRLQVSGDGEMSLLANDSDDKDERNQKLKVITTADASPNFAADFQLFEDGGFIYEPADNAPLSSSGSISDAFTYSVTDGSNVSSAIVRVRIIEFNTPPTLNAPIPEIDIAIGDFDQDITFFNLRNYYSDAQNDTLTFVTADTTLPASGNVYVTEDGLLKGNPSADDSGRYFVSLRVSDSVSSVDTGFYVNVQRSNGRNRAPSVDDIDNMTFTSDFQYDVSEFFNDRDGDHLSFTATRLPDGIRMTAEGVIFGAPSRSNRGESYIRVTANDGNGGTDSDGFRIILR